MNKTITCGISCMEKILEGADKIADAFRITAGPKGRNILINSKKAGTPVIAGTGEMVTDILEMEDSAENMGVKLIREAVSKTKDLAGDGTAVTAILFQAMLHEAFRYVAAGYQPVELRKGMQMAAQMAEACIRKMAVPAKAEEIAGIASVSAGEEEIGKLVERAVRLAGKEGVVQIEESPDLETNLIFQEGMVFERGYLHPQMATDREKQIAELKNPYILITDEKLSRPMDMVPVLEIAKAAGRPLFLIAEEIQPAVMGMLMKNKEALGMDIVGIRPPFYGEGRTWSMEDLAVLTGGAYVSGNFGLSVKDVTEEMLGAAKQVTVGRRQTRILGVCGDPRLMEQQKSKLRRMIEITDYEFNRKRYQERLAKFVSGVAVIRAGGITETEMREKKLRAERGYHAAAAALEEGTVPGGGVAFLNIMPPIRSFMDTLSDEKRLGAAIVLAALKRPFCQILENAGLPSGQILEKVCRQKRGTGYDVEREVYTDMRQAGILDPVKVVRTELATAVSAVSTLLTVEAFVTEKK